MIRRNVAGQTIYLPQLVLAADGTAVTSSATLTVGKDGTEAASAGTLAHVANGVWKYTPTQAETDAAIVGLVLTATNAVPVVLNLVTTAANTQAVAFGANTTTPPTAAANASQVRTELTTELARIDVATSTRLSTLGTNAPANWINAAAIATGAITNAKFASGAIDAASIASNAITSAKIAANAIGATQIADAALTAAKFSSVFPANFAVLGINASGHVSRVVLVDTTTANSDMRGTDNALLATNYTAPANADIGTILTEIGKIPRRATAIAAGSFVMTITGGQDAEVTYSEPA